METLSKISSLFVCGLKIRSCMCSASVLAGGGPTEEPDPPAVNQTLHRPPTSSRSLLPDGPQLQAEDCAEEGEESAFTCGPPPPYRLSLLMTTLSVCVQVSSTAGRISVPRLSVGAVSSRPSTPTLGEQPGSESSAKNLDLHLGSSVCNSNYPGIV